MKTKRVSFDFSDSPKVLDMLRTYSAAEGKSQKAVVIEALESFFAEKMELAQSAGLAEESLILDPGIDFAKQRDDNLAIYRDLGRLHVFLRPILLPVSRKTVIGEVLGLESPRDRDAGTMACIAAGMRRGAQIFRVQRELSLMEASLSHDSGFEAGHRVLVEDCKLDCRRLQVRSVQHQPHPPCRSVDCSS